MPKSFKDLTELEIIALAISLEEEDGRTYADFADRLHADYPATAAIFRDMLAEESQHRQVLIDLFRQRFGEHIPLISRQDVKGFIRRKPAWLIPVLGVNTVRKEAEIMEIETRRFYERAAARTHDAATRKLLGDLAEAERKHADTAAALRDEKLTTTARKDEDIAARRLFVLQIVQPGLVGLMDGSVSSLAPIFAAAFATHNTWYTFLVGLAASVGAGISMGFAEALSDDGALSGRGRPWLRGVVCGLMTTLGGLGHTLPYLIPHFWTATTVAIIVVIIELAIISWIRHRYMDSPWLSAALQVGFGGALVFAAGILIGSS